MITDSEPSGSRRSLRIALLLSLLVHATGAAVYGLVPLQRLLQPHARATPEQMVTISDSIRIEKKAVVPRRAHRAASHPRPAPQPPLARAPSRAAAAVAAAPVVPERPEIAPAPAASPPVRVRAKHELAKFAPHAAAQPHRTVVAKVTAPPPTAEPTVPATREPATEPATAPPHVRPGHAHAATISHRARPAPPLPKTVALAAAAPARPARPSQARLTPEQIARIDSDLASSIARDRSEENPLRVPKTAAAAPRHYHMSVDSLHVGALKAGEGTYVPIDAGHRGADGYDYYRCAYAYQWADGTFERGVVPWPVRFAPSEDPVLHPELERGGSIGLPPPPPGFVLSPGERVGRALRSYFPHTVFADE